MLGCCGQRLMAIDIPEQSRQRIARQFPKFVEHVNFEFTSEVDYNYNCLSWALSRNDRLFENVKWGYWPWKDIPDDTAHGWFLFLQKMGFAPCENASFEPGVERIAVLENEDREIHACRQIQSGVWKSKLGDMGPDIDHVDLECLKEAYGDVAYILAKRREDWL